MTAVHPDPHPLAGQTVLLHLAGPTLPVAVVTVEDWWDRETGLPWDHRSRTETAMLLSEREEDLPDGVTGASVVLVVDVEGTHHAVHDSELGDPVEDVGLLAEVRELLGARGLAPQDVDDVVGPVGR